jgi:hypothetical protein
LVGNVVEVAIGTVEVVELGTGTVKVSTVGDANGGSLRGAPSRRISTPLGEPIETAAPSASAIFAPPRTGTVAAYSVVCELLPVI